MNNAIWECLQDVLVECCNADIFHDEEATVGYDLPDGKHHLFIYVDEFSNGYNIVIEPNLIVDGGHEPCGEPGLCEWEDFNRFLIEVAWVIETQCK